MTTRYTLLDEPRRSGLSEWCVNPLWIFLACLLGGISIGWAWFLWNSFALGSATKKKEVALVLLGVAGSAAFWFLAFRLLEGGQLSSSGLPYFHLLLTALQLGVTYLLHLAQQRSFELHEYFGGRVRNGMMLLIGLSVLRQPLAQKLGNIGFFLL
jgi:hypothetical protein